MSDNRTACYLYCLTPSWGGVRGAAVGVDGQRAVSVHECGGFGAVASEVELEEFCGESAEARLQDLAWLGPRVCRHEAVIEEVMRQAPVMPLRFATLFTSVDSLRQAVLEHRDAIIGFFTRLGDRQEWAVKGMLNRAAAMVRPCVPAPEDSVPGASAGARYFQEKRIQAQWERDFNLRLKDFRRRAAAALGAHAGGFRERHVSPPVAAGGDDELVWNWAFLLPPAGLGDFRARLESFQCGEAFPGLTLALTGPWPPFSFAPDLTAGAKA
jgi:hypothetical protein